MLKTKQTQPAQLNSKPALRVGRAVKRQFPFYLMMIPGLFFMFILCYLPMPGIIIAFKDYRPRPGIWGSRD